MTRGHQAAHRRRRGARWPLALAGSAQEPTEQHELVDVAGVPRQHDPGGLLDFHGRSATPQYFYRRTFGA